LPTDVEGVNAAFDTHSSVKTLTAVGMSEAQAEAITELLRTAREADLSVLATKTDLAQLKADLQRELAEVKGDFQREIASLRGEIAEIRGDVQREIAGIRVDVQREIAAVRGEIAETRADILKWIVGLVGGAVLINVMAVVGAMLALVRLAGH
jgi:peptidoglycan hydrolase CwlO-like protein